MKDKYTVAFLFIILLFVLFPFFFFTLLVQFHNTFFFDARNTVPIIIGFGLLFAFFIEKFLRGRIHSDLKNTLFIISAGCVALYAGYLFVMTWSRCVNFISEQIDVMYFHTVIWQFSEFILVPYLYILDKPTIPLYAQHFSPILLFLAPLYWFIHDANLLMLVQAIAVISGAYPIYRIARYRLKSRSIGIAMSFAYLAFGGLQFGFAYGFHEIMFFPTLFLWSYYWYLHKHIKRYLLFIFLSLLVKEEVSFIMIFWGLYLFFVRKDKLFGAITSIFGLVWYFLCFHIIFPYFNRGQGFGYWGQYDTSNGSGIVGIAKFALFQPLSFLQTLVTPVDKIQMMLLTFGAFSFLVFLFPPALIIVFPSLMEKLLSSNIAMANGAHYSAAITAVLVVATFEAFPHLLQYRIVKKYIHEKNMFFSSLILFVALFSNVFFGYRGYSLIPFVHTSIYEHGLSDPNSILLNQIIQAIPKNATVATQAQIQPQIHAHFKNIIGWPFSNNADFIIIDTELLPVLTTSQDLNIALDKLATNKDYQQIVNQFGVVVYRKKSFTP